MRSGTCSAGAASEYVCLASTTPARGWTKRRGNARSSVFYDKAGRKRNGVGLATVYGLVKQHGGFVQIDSAPGRAHAYELLPVAEEVARRRGSGVQVLESEAAERQETILVVEDQAQLRRATVYTLERAGYSVLSAGDGYEALQLLRQHPEPIDLVFTDLVMGRLGGRGSIRSTGGTGAPRLSFSTSGYAGRGAVKTHSIPPCRSFPSPGQRRYARARARDAGRSENPAILNLIVQNRQARLTRRQDQSVDLS